MTIQSKMTKQGFIDVNFVLLYSKITIKIYTAFMVCWLLFAIAVASFSDHGSFVQVLGPLFMLIFIPLLTYVSAVKNFNTSQRITETMFYHFESDYMAVTGESFNSQLSWDKIYKVTVTKNWLFIWQNRAVGNPIPKENISQEQIVALKQILENHKVKNNL